MLYLASILTLEGHCVAAGGTHILDSVQYLILETSGMEDMSMVAVYDSGVLSEVLVAKSTLHLIEEGCQLVGVSV